MTHLQNTQKMMKYDAVLRVQTHRPYTVVWTTLKHCIQVNSSPNFHSEKDQMMALSDLTCPENNNKQLRRGDFTVSLEIHGVKEDSVELKGLNSAHR